MNRIPFSLGVLFISAILVCGCSQDPNTDALSIQYGPISITVEKKDGKQQVEANMVVRLVNRTEHAMSVAFLEGSIIDAQTNLAVVRFRPIIPQSYGTISSAQLIPKQSKEFTAITPPGLEGFDATKSPRVIIKISFQTTDGYRAEVASAPVSVSVK